MRKLATIMQGSQTIKPLSVRLAMNGALLAFFIALLTLTCAPSQASASTILSAENPGSAWDMPCAQEVLFSEKELPGWAVEDFVWSQSAVGRVGVAKQTSEAYASASTSEKTEKQTEYVSVSGYSASSHFFLALEATIAAGVVVLICVVGFFAYRFHKRNREKVLTQSGNTTSVIPGEERELLNDTTSLS